MEFKVLKMKKIGIYIILILLISCNDNDIFEEQEGESILVVDGWIENDRYARVILTRTTPYFSIVDSSTYLDLVEYAAKVTVSDGINSDVLTVGKDERYFPPLHYHGTKIKGETGKTYYLTISKSNYYNNTDSLVYDTIATAITTIPKVPKIDTAWFELEPPKDSLGVIKMTFTDDTTEHNFYKVYTAYIEEKIKYIPVISATIDDDLFDKPVNTYTLFKGTYGPIMQPEDVYFKIGESVRIKLATLTEESYNFWNLYQLESLNAINPFASSSTNLQGNINGDGIGIWTGQAFAYYDIEIK